MRLTVATKNRDKIKEIREILQGLPFELYSLTDLGFKEEIEETGDTFEKNALIKARAVHSRFKGYVMADDSGLCIDALDGAPGVYSSRFAGEDSGYDYKMARILEMLKDVKVEHRTAGFVCVIALVRPDGSHFTVKGEMKGIIHQKPEGEKGFGYDPIFYVPKYAKTVAQMSDDLKNIISHRAVALRKMREILDEEKNHK